MFLFFVLCFSVKAQEKNIISVNVISKENVEQIILERNNKFLLINIWATWCLPCREEFPDLVKLSSSFNKSLDVIGISVDYPDEIESKIKPFLKKVNVNFPVFVSGFKNDEELITSFSNKWNGALPATFIYNSKGEQVKYLEGKHSYESFSSIIKNLIK